MLLGQWREPTCRNGLYLWHSPIGSSSMLYLTESYRGQRMHGVVDKKAMAGWLQHPLPWFIHPESKYFFFKKYFFIMQKFITYYLRKKRKPRCLKVWIYCWIYFSQLFLMTPFSFTLDNKTKGKNQAILGQHQIHINMLHICIDKVFMSLETRHWNIRITNVRPWLLESKVIRVHSIWTNQWCQVKGRAFQFSWMWIQ